MWVLTGPFDGEKNDTNFKKQKLLKSSTRYTLGRKERQITVNSGKVSHDHGAITVGSSSPDSVSDPTEKPTVTIVNSSKKTMTITRDRDAVPVSPSTSEDLLDGDTIDIVTGIPLSLRWHPICCYAPANRSKSSISFDACSSLGINVVYTSHPDVTHHLIPQFVSNPIVATSLISAAQFVKPEWLTEVIRLGNLPANDDPANGSSLEQNFSLPLETKYRPSFSTTLPPPLKVFKVWEPNEERINMLFGYRFLFVGEKGREVDSAVIELVKRGGGEYEVFDASKGRKKWHQAMAKGKARQSQLADRQKGLVIVADTKAMEAAIGKEGWEEFTTEAQSFDLNFIESDSILQAVLHVNTGLIHPEVTANEDDSGERNSSPLPDFVPNTHPDEPSYPPPTNPETGGGRRILKRRATPSAESRPPSPPVEKAGTEDEPRPRKILKRRANAPPSIVGIDDPSGVDIDVSAGPSNAAGASHAQPSDPPVPTRSRLKRRVGTLSSSHENTQDIASQAPIDTEEPKLKKFKALYDASDPDNQSVPEGGMSYGTQMPPSQSMPHSGTQTLTQSGTLADGVVDVNAIRMSAIAEEEEESTMTLGEARGLKRKARHNGDDVEMADAGREGQIADGRPNSKRRAIEHNDAVHVGHSLASGNIGVTNKSPSQRPSSKSGAPSNKPDVDTAFLKAVASTKKGKKTEDSFDREFNNLKISIPDAQSDEQEKQWGILDDFETERDIRGNFMVVVEMDVGSKQIRSSQERPGRPEWQEKPNFKKFKKKILPSQRARIELLVNEENDYGMGAGYWKGQSQSQSQGDAPMSQAPPQRQDSMGTQMRQAKSSGFVVAESDDEHPPRRTQSRAKQSKGTQGKRAAASTSEQSRPLFFEDDDDYSDNMKLPKDEDDDEPVLGDDDDNMTSTLISTAQKTQTPATTNPKSSKPISQKRAAKKAPVIVDDDSDDGATFRGFKGKKRTLR